MSRRASPVRQLLYGSVSIYEYVDRLDISRPRALVAGFPDTGLVGAIAVRHMIGALNMRLFGELDSEAFFSTIAVVHDGSPMAPIQIYGTEDGSVMAILSEIPLPPAAVPPISQALIEYARDVGADALIGLTGIPIPNRLEIQTPAVYALALTEKVKARLRELNVEELKEGFIAGVFAHLLKEGRRRGYNGLVLLAESFLDFPDPEAAASALRVLSKVISVDINVDELLKQADMIRLRTRDLMKSTRRTLSDMSKELEMQVPLMYQ